MSNVTENREEILVAAENFTKRMDDEINALAHYGVKGMKWGVRNAETLRKYGLGSAKKAASGIKNQLTSAVSSATSGIKAKMNASKQNRIAKRETIRQNKAELKAQRKELGMSRKDFDKLRETTLKSHDPSVVAKGMHTLTDEELKSKIKRLQEEDKISKMAVSREKSKHEIHQARNEALNKNPLVQVGKSAASPFLTKAVNELGYGVLVQQGAKPLLEQKVARALYKAQAREHARAAAEAASEYKSDRKQLKSSNIKVRSSQSPAQQSTASEKSTTQPKASSGSAQKSASAEAAVTRLYGMKPTKVSSTMAVGKARISMSDVRARKPAEWDYRVSRNPKYDSTETSRKAEAARRMRNAYL